MGAVTRSLSVAGVVLAICAVVGCGGGERTRLLRPGMTAPSLRLPSLSGDPMDSADLSGEPVILNFWATWCRPCLEELPVLSELSSEGVRVVAVALDEEGARVVAPFVEEHGIDYTVLLGDQEVFRRFSGFAIPFTLVLDPSWKVVAVHRGPVEREELLAELASFR